MRNSVAKRSSQVQIPQGNKKLKCSVLRVSEAWGLCSLQLSENAGGSQGAAGREGERGNPNEETLLQPELMMFSLPFKHLAAYFCRFSLALLEGLTPSAVGSLWAKEWIEVLGFGNICGLGWVATAWLLGLRPDAQLLLPTPNGNGGKKAAVGLFVVATRWEED